MKMNKIAAAVCLVAASSVTLVGCFDDDDKTGGSTPVPEAEEFLAIDGYLQNAICCVDTNNNKSCSDETTASTTDINGVCQGIPAGTQGVRIAYAKPDGTTTMSDEPGVTGSAAPEGAFLSGPSGTAAVTAFTTLLQNQIELTGRPLEEVQAEIVEQLGLPAGTNLSTFDYVKDAAADGASPAVKRAKVIAETVVAMIAANLVTLQERGVGGNLSVQVATAVGLVLDAGNSAGVNAGDGVSLFDFIVSTVNATPEGDLGSSTGEELYLQIAGDENVNSIEDADDEDLNEFVDDIEVLIPTGPTGN